MQILENLFHVEIKASDKNRHYWATRRELNTETKKVFSEADVLFLPWENKVGGKDVYPTGTAELINTFGESTKAITFAIVVDQNEYIELSLHSNTARWPVMLVTTVSLGVFSSLLANQIDRLLTSKPETTKIEMGLIIQNKEGKCVEFNYTGPPREFVDNLLEGAKRCFPEEVEIINPSYNQNRIESSHSD